MSPACGKVSPARSPLERLQVYEKLPIMEYGVKEDPLER